MRPLPHERRRFADKLRYIRDRLRDDLEQGRRHPERTINEVADDMIAEPETQAALTWAIEALEE